MSAANGYVVSDSEDIDSSMSGVIKPPDIEQDLKEMERRKRVDMVINSQLFREELERIIESQINEGYAPSSLSALQQVTELLLPNSARNSSLTRIGSSAIPINDIRGVDAFNYDKGEKLLRCKLASVYRLVDLYGWSQSIYNHISVRVNQDHEHFLLNPFGLQYHEVTASSLLKVDMQGNLVNPGSTNFGFNRAGWVLHSAIHSARPDIKAIIHIHHPTCVAISSMKCGLLKISQEAAIIGDVSYHDFRGIVVDTEEREIIARNLGPFNKVLLLRNHGAIACGETIEEALHLMHNLVIACETQAKLIHVGVDNIHQMSKEAVDQVRSIVKMAVSQVHGKPEDTETKVKQTGDEDTKDRPRKWKVWDLEFEAQMRMLDNAGFRTGYLYRQPLLRADQQRIKYDVEIPPAATSLHQYFEGDKWLSPLKKLVDGKKTQDKLKWVNSPNSYQKVEIPESGTQDPKKITKWVQDSSPPHGNPVKIENAHQFVPVVADPTEFRRKQKEMKQIRMDNKISGGPQSHILEGVTWEDVGHKPAENDQVVLVGAASKGIIQREYQHNAKVYKSAYAKNPFDDVSDKELEEYKEYVARKQRGEPVDDVPERFRHLLLEPVPEHLTDGRMNQQRSLDDQITSPTEDTEETSEEGQLTPAPRSFLKRLLRKSMRSSPHHDKEKDHHEKDVAHHQEDAHHEKEEEKKEERKEEKKKDKEHREKEKEKEKHHEDKKEKKSRKRQDKSRSDKAHAEKAR